MLDNPDPISNLTFARPSLSDAAAVLDLMIAVDIAEYGEPDSELEDLLQEWQEIDLSQDVWLVYDHQNRVVGYGKVAVLDEGFQMDFYVHPQSSPGELRDEIITRCEKRVQELQHSKGDQPAVDLNTIVSQANPEN
ncbi:MAG: hypothetical protein KAT29_14305, partial [Anaerolineales bacterium]|nr:hypothetical protein [Anaerolineales bacterium]